MLSQFSGFQMGQKVYLPNKFEILRFNFLAYPVQEMRFWLCFLNSNVGSVKLQNLKKTIKIAFVGPDKPGNQNLSFSDL